MNVPLKFRFAAFLAAFLFAGCSLTTPSAQTPTLDATAAYQTVEAQLTAAVTPSLTATATSSPTATRPSAQQTSTWTTSPTLTETASNGVTPTLAGLCDKAAAGNPIDVTIEDGTRMYPGQQFTKTWRLVNAGTCTWTRSYRAVWFFGDKFGDTLSVQLNHDVKPGESVEITVDMTAPSASGSYRSNWKLQNADGKYFGIGPNADAPFWVEITVEVPAADTATQQPAATTTPAPTLTATATITPTATLTPTQRQPVQVSGEASLLPGSTIDLDTGTANPESGEDVEYTKDTDLQWLTPQGGAVLGVYGSGEPSYNACQSAGKSTAPIAVQSLSLGSYLCYRTGDGMLGWMRLDKFSPEESSLAITYTTWAE